MTKNISISKVRANLTHVLDDIKEHMHSYIISKRGVPKVILMSIDDYEGWLETLSIMSDEKTMSNIRKAEKELAHGKYCSLEDVCYKKRKS